MQAFFVRGMGLVGDVFEAAFFVSVEAVLIREGFGKIELEDMARVLPEEGFQLLHGRRLT